VSDIGLPDEDGYALIQRIRALPIDRGGQTPAAALTGYADQGTRERTLSAGYQVYVAKPVETTTLMDVIAGLASRGRHNLLC
jgi:CheY-like chemotaxis protein